MSRLRSSVVVAATSVIGILGLVVFWVLRLGVRPLKRMTATAEPSPPATCRSGCRLSPPAPRRASSVTRSTAC